MFSYITIFQASCLRLSLHFKYYIYHFCFCTHTLTSLESHIKKCPCDKNQWETGLGFPTQAQEKNLPLSLSVEEKICKVLTVQTHSQRLNFSHVNSPSDY